MTPSSIKGGSRLSSWHLDANIRALPRIKVTESRPKSWLLATPSSNPLLLASWPGVKPGWPGRRQSAWLGWQHQDGGHPASPWRKVGSLDPPDGKMQKVIQTSPKWLGKIKQICHFSTLLHSYSRGVFKFYTTASHDSHRSWQSPVMTTHQPLSKSNHVWGGKRQFYLLT